MTLHEAIDRLLKEKRQAMTTLEIAEDLNKNKWYQKKDSSAITAYQIHGRTKDHPDLFERQGGLVSSKGGFKSKIPITVLLGASSENQIMPSDFKNGNSQSIGKSVEGKISSELIIDIQKCQKCVSIIDHKKFPTNAHGNLNGKYLLVSEAPGKKSLLKEKYWTGFGGQILRSCASAANTTLEQLFYLTDIVKCWPNDAADKDRAPLKIEIMNCSHFLTKEIDELKPQLILSLGKPASSFLLKREVKVKSEHGKMYRYRNTNTVVLVMLHPSGIDRQRAKGIYMDRKIYTEQLTSVFQKLKENKLSDIETIFK